MNAALPTSNRGLRATDRIRLRADVFDEAAKRLGAETETELAQLLDVDRTTLYRIRSGKTTPSLELAMHWSTRLELTVEQLFEQVV